MLSKAARIAFSKKIVSAPDEIAAVDAAIAALQIQSQEALVADGTNKEIFDPINDLVTHYHSELSHYTGIIRTSITEQDMIDASMFIITNSFYPQNPSNPPPSLAPMVWAKTRPYSRNLAVGKTFAENYPSATVTVVQTLVSQAINLINPFVASYTNIQRATGFKCAPNPLNPPVIDNDLRDDGADIVTEIQAILSELGVISAVLFLNPDTDSARVAQNTALLNTVDQAINDLNAWLSLQNYSAFPPAGSCAAFNAINPNTLLPSKFRDAEFTPIQTLLSNLNTAFNNRQTYLQTTVLGDISQNMSTGDATGTGLYFQRWGYIELRIGMIAGSLVYYQSILRSIDSAHEQKDLIISTVEMYSDFIYATKLAAPTSGTKYVQAVDASGLSVGDRVWIVSDTQDEFMTNIESIVGNRLTLGYNVPAKFRDFEYGRVYKEK